MAALLAGLPENVPGTTINRLCASGMDAVGMAARGIKAGDYRLAIAGGVESMSRAPFVMPKAETAFARSNTVYDTTIGWRFVNRKFKSKYGTDSMPETADNVAEDYRVSRADQDAFAAQSQERYAAAAKAGLFADELFTVSIAQRKGEPLLIGNEEAAKNHKPLARVIGMAAAGVKPRIMGIGPVPAVRKLLRMTGLTIEQMDVIELNEAFAAQGLAVMRELGLADDAAHVNPNGGAIALGHPLGMSGARLVMTAAYQLRRTGGRYALCTMCVGVGQGTALILERT